jgi:NADH:ubiquinone oxidoreductase subunit
MSFIRQMFVWWQDATLGTRVTTWLSGSLVGSDAFGNRYYQSRKGGKPARRWVVFKGTVEASRVPPEWHGWLHHTFDELPDTSRQARSWEKPHQPNLSGTPEAYRPQGSLWRSGRHAPATGDYEAWTPK